MLRRRATTLKKAAAARAGATLSETLLAAAAIGLVLMLAALGVEQIRSDLKIRQTRELLMLLRSALLAYQQSFGAWPEPHLPPEEPPARGAIAAPEERAARGMVTLLWSVEACRPHLERIAPVLRDAGPFRPHEPASDAAPVLHDSWGTPLWCLTAQSTAQVHREAVAAHGGCPIFISAGQDRDFGAVDRSATADNLRSDELPPATRPQ